MNIRMKLTAVLALAATLPVLADIKINDNLSVNGYGVGSYEYFKQDKSTSTDSLNVDSALLGATISYKPVTAVFSFYYVPNTASGLDVPTGHSGVNQNGDEVTLLDANVTYDTGSGITMTAGRFLSYMGYESFYPIHMDQISYADGDFLAPIPGYHEGVHIDYSDKSQTAGLALVDSVYSPYGATKGDGELKHNGGLEAYYSYVGITNLTLWAGYAYDSKGGFEVHSISTFDFWASYQIDKQTRVAAEYVNKDGGTGNKGYNWIVFGDYTFAESKFSLAGRISGEKLSNGGPGFTKYTICPTYAVTDHLSVRAEYSYYHYTDFTSKDANFFGVQTIFQF
ncbi:MAG TPA: outer membrane beta-barrel protein [Opitutaceae bacterium]|jgi:hypothetical protein|nr:outer membrane beta-barrel protein [Opitutaceae bacterium]